MYLNKKLGLLIIILSVTFFLISCSTTTGKNKALFGKAVEPADWEKCFGGKSVCGEKFVKCMEKDKCEEYEKGSKELEICANDCLEWALGRYTKCAEGNFATGISGLHNKAIVTKVRLKCGSGYSNFIGTEDKIKKRFDVPCPNEGKLTGLKMFYNSQKQMTRFINICDHKPTDYVAGKENVLSCKADELLKGIKIKLDKNGFIADIVDKKCMKKPAVCGNNKKEGKEVCDGTDLASKSLCKDFDSAKYTSGKLKCKADCSGFDVGECIEKQKTKKQCSTDQDCDDGNKDTIEYCHGLLLSKITNPSCKSFDLKSIDATCKKVYSGTNPKKIKLVFVSSGLSKNNKNHLTLKYPTNFPYLYNSPLNLHWDLFDQSIQEELNPNGRGFFGFEPYKSHKEWFDVYQVKSNAQFDCGYKPRECNIDLELVRLAVAKYCSFSKVDEPFINIMEASRFTGQARLGKKGKMSYSSFFHKTNTLHEMGGHVIGELADEYLSPNFYVPSIQFGNKNRCEEWCNNLKNPIKGGKLNQSKECYPYYINWKKCIDLVSNNPSLNTNQKKNGFKSCWQNARKKFFQEKNKILESDCKLGWSCISDTSCIWTVGVYSGVDFFRPYKDSIMRWADYSAGYKKVNPAEGIYYSVVRLPTLTERKNFIYNHSLGKGTDTTLQKPEVPLDEFNWWILLWDHLDTGSCPKWCSGFDKSSKCYSYYDEFKTCADKIHSNPLNRKKGLFPYIDAQSCWDKVAKKYKQATGKNLAEGCALGLNCKDQAECIWPGGGMYDPFGTFRKNKEFPYFGFGLMFDKFVESRLKSKAK